MNKKLLTFAVIGLFAMSLVTGALVTYLSNTIQTDVEVKSPIELGFSDVEGGPYLEIFPTIEMYTGGNREFTLYMREENLASEIISGDVLTTVTNSEGLTCGDFEEMYLNVKHLAPAPEVDWVPSNGGINVMLWGICNEVDPNTITFNYPTQAFEAGLIEISKIDVTFTEGAFGTYAFESVVNL